MAKTGSAQRILGGIVSDFYQKARTVKKEGGLVGWSATNFPVEIIETLDLTVVYPEQQAAMLILAGGEDKLYRLAEEEGYAGGICSFAKIGFGSLRSEDGENAIPRPDYLLCCNNVCHQQMKWFENIAHDLGVPLFFLDIPFISRYPADANTIEYIRRQFHDIANSLEKMTGNEFSEEKLRKVMAVSTRAGEIWLEIGERAACSPSPFNGIDLFMQMAAMVCARAKEETVAALEQLLGEIDAQIANGTTRNKFREKQRILYDGIACWPHLYDILSSFAKRDINIVASLYTTTFALVYQNSREMFAAYAHLPGNVGIERGQEMREALLAGKNIDGVVFHLSKSCKMWSGTLYEQERRLADDFGVPTVMFDGDQGDGKAFSREQFETRMQGFSEVMEDA